MNIIKRLFIKKVLKEANYSRDKSLLTIKYKNGEKEEYVGIANVWYQPPLMKRCTIEQEAELFKIYKNIKLGTYIKKNKK